jgi:hypothetical protein
LGLSIEEKLQEEQPNLPIEESAIKDIAEYLISKARTDIAEADRSKNILKMSMEEDGLIVSVNLVDCHPLFSVFESPGGKWEDYCKKAITVKDTQIKVLWEYRVSIDRFKRFERLVKEDFSKVKSNVVKII